MPTQPRVLMVEDHPDIADLYQLKLQLEGYRVAVASNGMTGLQLARELKPDVSSAGKGISTGISSWLRFGPMRGPVTPR